MGGLTRRTFVGISVGGAAGAALGCDIRDADEFRRPGRPAGVRPFELDEVTIDELAAGMREGRWTARGITELYLDRIAEIDRAGPALRSVIETNPDALEIAERLDEERAQGRVRGPLHGVPILIKDNIGTADRMTTTAGSFALEGSVPAADSFVARRLREAGAILLGKANLSEWANFRSTRSSSGWSARGGQCRNPWVLDRNPCGSSSGSGAAVAANLCAASVGTETDGSIVCPSSANGIVGIKPTVGLVSRSRIVPISHTQDTAGPMARTVRDAALLLSALAGEDTEDAATADARGNTQADYTQFLDPNGLRGARVGVARDFFGFHTDVDALMDEVIATLEAGGATIVDEIRFAGRDELGAAEWEVLLYDFKADLDAYLSALPATTTVRSLADAIAFNEANREVEMPWFGQEIFELAVEKGPLTEPAYRTALATCRRLARTEGIDTALSRHRLDAILAPTGGPAWTTDLVNGDHFGGGSSTHAAVAGYPNITVPAGYVSGLPVGVSFFGAAWSEPVLLRIAYAYEQASANRRMPGFVESLGV